MESDEPRLQPLLPPIPPTSIAINDSPRTFVGARRSSVTATLNDGPDLPSPRLALFASPLVVPQQAAQTPPDKRKRRLRASVVHTKQLRTPRSLKLQHYAHSSPFHLTSPVHHLSLLSPSHTPPPSSPPSHPSSTAHSRTAPQSPTFLHPLTHRSSLGLTLSPPTLNWTVAAGVLSEAELRSSELLCREVSVNVERVIAVDRLIGVDMRNEVREVEGEERRVRARRWREEEQQRRDRDDEDRKQQQALIVAAIRRDQARVDAARSALLEQRYLEWRYRDESVEDEELADDQRLVRYDTYHASQLRISLNKQEESAAWKNEWRTIQLQQQQRLAEERAATLARQQAEQQRINAAYTAARLKAKQGRLQLTIVRAKPLITPFLPANTVAYFVAQLVADPPTQSLDYPTPLSELRYAPFMADVLSGGGGETAAVEDGEEESEGVEVGWSCEWVAKSVAKTTLVISWQCCDRDQKDKFDKWVRKRERQRKKDAAAAAATADDQQQQQQQQTNKKPNKPTKAKQTHKPAASKKQQATIPSQTAPSNSRKQRSSKPANSSASSATEEQLSAIKRTKKLKDSRSHSHRHKVITRVLELGRVELKLRDVREREEGEWKGMVEVAGVSWQARAAADERRRRRKRGKHRSINVDNSDAEPGDIDSPALLSPTMLSPTSSRPATSTSSMSAVTIDSSQQATAAAAAGLSKAERENQRLSAAHLAMNPSSLYPSRLREKRSELQLLLMTEKERQQYQDDEERKERMRRDKDDKERRKWSRKVGELWFELRLLPLDADGKLLVKEGDKRAEAKEREDEEEEEVDEVDDGEGQEKEDGEDVDDGEADEDDADEEEDEDEEEQAATKKTVRKSRPVRPKAKKESAKGRAQVDKTPQAEYLAQQQLRSKAFPVMD